MRINIECKRYVLKLKTRWSIKIVAFRERFHIFGAQSNFYQEKIELNKTQCLRTKM